MGVWGRCDQWRNLHSISETVDAHHPWRMYKPSQVVLRVSDSKYRYRRYNSRNASESCVESTCLDDKKVSFIGNFHSWSLVRNPTALGCTIQLIPNQDTHIRCCSTCHSNRAVKEGHRYNLCVSPPSIYSVQVHLLTFYNVDNQVPASVWTCIEPAVGIVTACLPNMGPLLQRVPRKFWIRMNPSSNENSDQERGNPIAQIHLTGAFKHSG